MGKVAQNKCTAKVIKCDILNKSKCLFPKSTSKMYQAI